MRGKDFKNIFPHAGLMLIFTMLEFRQKITKETNPRSTSSSSSLREVFQGFGVLKG